MAESLESLRRARSKGRALGALKPDVGWSPKESHVKKAFEGGMRTPFFERCPPKKKHK